MHHEHSDTPLMPEETLVLARHERIDQMARHLRQVHMAKDSVEAHMVKELLEARGIAATVVGHYEDPFAASVWIAEEPPFQQAREVILALSGPADETESEPWCCPGCSEQIEPQFTQCWNCGPVHFKPSCGEDEG